MLPITNILGETFLLNGIPQVDRGKKVNGEKTISFRVFPTEENKHAFNSVENETKVEFENEKYIIKKVQGKNIGQTFYKTVEAVHVFFDDMINCFQYDLHSGSQTFFAAMTKVFEPTSSSSNPYTFTIQDSFAAETFENFGRDNCLSLFQNAIARYEAEFEVVGNNVFIKRKIGADTGFQLRWKSNIKAIDKEVDTQGLSTYIKGFGGTPNEAGVYPITREYDSNIEKFGLKVAQAVYDEATSTIEGMDARLRKELISEPQLSITVDIATVEGEVKNEGDTGFIIYEPMDIKVAARVVEISETFEYIDLRWKAVKSNVTLSNFKNKLSDAITRFGQTSKQVDRLFQGIEKLPYNVLPEAVRRASDAINNSFTEIQYPVTGGFLLQDPNNNNLMVRITSTGVGLSQDGGATYKTAMTGLGIVADEIIAGILQGMTFLSDDGTSTMWVQGGDIRLTDSASGRNTNINALGMVGFNEAGEIQFQANKTWVTSSILGTNTTNVYLAAEANGEARIVDINGIPGNGLVDSYNYLPIRASGIYGNFWNINPASGNNAQNLYARPLSDGEVRVTANSTTDLYRDLRARNVYANAVENNLLFGESVHMYVRSRAAGEVRATAAGTSDEYVPVRASGFYGAFLDTPETHVYIRPAGDPGEARVTVRGGTDVYQPIRAKDFITDTSVRENKKNIENYELNTLDIIRKSSAYLYNRKTDKEGARKQLGLMIDELPEVTHSDAADSFALYALSAFNFKGNKDVLAEVDRVRTDFEEYKTFSTNTINELLKRVEALEAT